MEVTVLYVPACPNVDRATRRLREALDATGVVATITETEVSTPTDAARLGMRGSPTILLDGHDPFAEPNDPTSISCRLYDVGGAVDGAPSVEQIVSALERPGPVVMPRSDVDGELLTSDLGDRAIALATAGFAALWDGRAEHPADLLPGQADDAKELVSGLVERGRCEIDGDGRLVGIHGLTLRTTRHSFDHAGVAHHTWCAFDSIGIPAALHLDAVAHTDCRACGQTMHVEIASGQPRHAEDAVLWLPAVAGDHLMNAFCATADLYCSSAHLRDRIDTAATPGEIVDLATAAATGRATWADVASPPLSDGTQAT